MDQFYLSIPQNSFQFHFEHGDEHVLLGSCFSDEIAKRLKYSGHHLLVNPFGTLFHPLALTNMIHFCFDESADFRIFQRANRFYSWYASTTISSDTEIGLIEQLNALKQTVVNRLKSAKTCIVTFGTSWGYLLNDTEELVANCHKMPSEKFRKILSSPYDIVQDWILTIDLIKQHNPEIEFIFTISPVRHIRDGLVENNLSKARLLEAVQQLCMESNCHYFHSYELMIDVLRDYRFYKKDKIHPNEEAIDFIWKQFEQVFFDERTILMNQKIGKVSRMKLHQTEHTVEHQQIILEKQDALSAIVPSIKWY